MKRYKVKVNEIKTTVFELSANNKKEAQEMVEEIIYKTCILNLNCVNKTIEIKYEIKKGKGEKNYEKN